MKNINQVININIGIRRNFFTIISVKAVFVILCLVSNRSVKWVKGDLPFETYNLSFRFIDGGELKGLVKWTI